MNEQAIHYNAGSNVINETTFVKLLREFTEDMLGLSRRNFYGTPENVVADQPKETVVHYNSLASNRRLDSL